MFRQSAGHDGDHVETQVVPLKAGVLREEVFGGADDSPPLMKADRFKGRSAAFTCFHFDKRQCASARGDDIDFARGHPEIAR